MSGGSFNYLCTKDVSQVLTTGMADMAEMAEELEGLGHLAVPVAERTRKLIDRIHEFEDEIGKELAALSPVWHAVEWWRSCDWSREQVFVALGEYRCASRKEQQSRRRDT